MVGVAGARYGVRRGRGKSGVIFVNGHPPIPAGLAAKIVDLIGRVGRPMTAREIGFELAYSRDHISQTCRDMAREGQLVQKCGVSNIGAAFSLPDLAVVDLGLTKPCAMCHRVLPIDEFHRDARQNDGRHSRCRQCRSPLADKAKVKTYERG